MPTKTFLNLPKEKQFHFLKFAKQEFTNHTLLEASINKILQDAKIPRGSFYQYFSNKEDLYFYVLKQDTEEILETIRTTIEQKDFLEIWVSIYDSLYNHIKKSKDECYYKNVILTLYQTQIQANPDIKELKNRLIQKLKNTTKTKEEILSKMIELLFFLLGKTLMESLEKEEEQEIIKNQYITLLKMIQTGIYEGGTK